MKKKWIPVAIAGALVFVALGGAVVMGLWNWLLPPLFGWHRIGFWQALGLLVLCRILFGGWGGGPGGRARARARGRAAEHWEAMTPEERERMRQGMRDKFGFGPPAGGAEPR